jgi:hypothetical protein
MRKTLTSINPRCDDYNYGPYELNKLYKSLSFVPLLRRCFCSLINNIAAATRRVFLGRSLLHLNIASNIQIAADRIYETSRPPISVPDWALNRCFDLN